MYTWYLQFTAFFQFQQMEEKITSQEKLIDLKDIQLGDLKVWHQTMKKQITKFTIYQNSEDSSTGTPKKDTKHVELNIRLELEHDR